MRRKIWAFTVVVFLIPLATTGATAVKEKPEEGYPAPDITVKSLDGKRTLKLSDLRNKKPVFLNFWASWCPPCREEMPSIQKLYERMKDEMEFVAISVDSNEDALKKFLKDKDYKFPIYHEGWRKAAELYKIRAIPTTFLIDKKGVIKVGPIQGSREYDKLEDKIREELGIKKKVEGGK
jgi:thiol-disulfide isomerase/thioredoxin